MSNQVPEQAPVEEGPTELVGASSAFNASSRDHLEHDVDAELPAQVEVGEGETLEQIAQRWGVDALELAELNAWFAPNPAVLFPGQLLRLPRGTRGVE